MLRFMPQKAAKDVYKVVQSAAANAENNYNLDADDAAVCHRISPTTAATLKRLQAARHGPRQPAAQAVEPHHGRGRGERGLDMGHKVHPIGFRLGIIQAWQVALVSPIATTTLRCTRTSRSAR